MRVLVVDDDPVLKRHISRLLCNEGHHVRLRAGADNLIELIVEEAIDLVILDPGLFPFRRARDFCSTVRKESTAMLLLVSNSADASERIRMLEAGADDILGKPVDLDEFLARIHALHRRYSLLQPGAKRAMVQVTRELVLDMNRQMLLGIDGEVPLSRTEFQMLTFFIRNEGAVLNREVILAGVWGHGYEGSSREVDVYVRYLRRKLEPECSQPRYIISIWGRGYQYKRPSRRTPDYVTSQAPLSFPD